MPNDEARRRAPLEVTVEIDREVDGRWIADAVDIPGVMAYGKTREEAVAKVKILALQVVTDRLERGEDPRTGCALGDACPTDSYIADFGGLDFAPVAMVS